MISKNKLISRVIYNGTEIPLKKVSSEGGDAVPEMGKYNAYYLEYSSATGKYEPTLIGGIKGGDVITLKEGFDVEAANTGTEYANPYLAFDGWSSPIEIVDNTITIPERISSDLYIGAMYHPADGKYHYIDDLGNDLTIMPNNRGHLRRCFIPYKVTSLNSFFDCHSLASIVIPNSVTSIGDKVFEDCESLSSIVIPDSVTSIGSYAFQNCYSLTSIVIPNSVTSIGSYAFQNCYSLTSIICPKIDDGIFFGCKSLISISILDNPVYLTAFSGCHSLTSVTIPNSVKYIGSHAFYACISLRYLYFKPIDPPRLFDDTSFFNIYSGCKIYVPIGSKAAYDAATNWSSYANKIVEMDVNEMP